jgi:hypothetical protein
VIARDVPFVNGHGGSAIWRDCTADHGATWAYVGILLTSEDARTLGATSDQINGGDLFCANDAYHLIATPVGIVDFPHGREDGYRGCVVVAIADLDAGRVARCDGAPVVEARYLGRPGQFVGACGASSTASGWAPPCGPRPRGCWASSRRPGSPS